MPNAMIEKNAAVDRIKHSSFSFFSVSCSHTRAMKDAVKKSNTEVMNIGFVP